MDSYISIGKVVLANKPLSNIELVDAVQHLKIPNFRVVFLRDTLPKRPNQKECGILNLDSSNGRGTHWVAWFKNKDDKYYFDSYGVQPPNEMIKYLQSPILYNTEQIQQADQVFSGHLCLYVLKEMSKEKGLQEIINGLYLKKNS